MSRKGKAKESTNPLEDILEGVTQVGENEEEIVVSTLVIRLRFSKSSGLFRVLLAPEIEELLPDGSEDFIHNYMVEYLGGFVGSDDFFRGKEKISKEIVKDLALDIQCIVLEYLLKDSN